MSYLDTYLNYQDYPNYHLCKICKRKSGYNLEIFIFPSFYCYKCFMTMVLKLRCVHPQATVREYHNIVVSELLKQISIVDINVNE